MFYHCYNLKTLIVPKNTKVLEHPNIKCDVIYI